MTTYYLRQSVQIGTCHSTSINIRKVLLSRPKSQTVLLGSKRQIWCPDVQTSVVIHNNCSYRWQTIY